MKPFRWSVVIPMWQEATRIDASIERLADSKLAHPDIELLLVDDGSTDGTAAQARAACERAGLVATVIELPANVGKGGAVRAGVLAASGEVVGFADADLSAGPEDIERVFRVVDEGEAPVAIASRTEPGTTIAARQPWLRRWSGAAFNLELRALGLTDLRDTQCGLKAFEAKAATEIFGALRLRRFAFDVEVLARARRGGFAIAEVPIRWEHVEASRVAPLRDGVRMAVDALRIRWWLRPGRSRSGAGAASGVGTIDVTDPPPARLPARAPSS